MDSQNSWSIAEGRQSFSRLVQASADSPQEIYKRDELVATVISAACYREFLEWKRTRARTVVARLAELQQICQLENYEFPAPVRTSRPNPFGELE